MLKTFDILNYSFRGRIWAAASIGDAAYIWDAAQIWLVPLKIFFKI